MKPFLLFLILMAFSCQPASTDPNKTPAEVRPNPVFEPTPGAAADAVAKAVSGKKWQSKADPDLTIEFRDGRLYTQYKGAERSDAPFVSFSDSCPGGKAPGEGMNAGFICCMTLAAKIETHYLVLNADAEKLEYIQDKTADAQAQVYTLLKPE